MEAAFYQNVFLLTQAVPPSNEFLKFFKEGMFDKPNTVGFLHVSQYLLTIYDANRFKKTCKWPLHCKKDEAEFRTSVKDFLTSVSRENPDLDFPQILASHLLHASGLKFSIIMWNLSTVTLRTYIKRETGMNLLTPKSGVAEDLSRMLFSNITAQSAKNIEDIDKKITSGEQNAKIYANETAESIQQNQEDLFLTRRRLMDMAPQAPVHPAMKNRLSDPNDTEVIEIWKKSVDESLMYLRRKQERLKELADLSNSVAAMVTSIASTDSNMLDGNRLPALETDTGNSGADGLSPETQISLHRLRVNGSMSLEDLLQLIVLYLADLRRYLEKQGFPDLAGCDSQVRASREDMNSINDLFRSIYERIIGLSSELKIRLDSESAASHKTARKDIRTNAAHFDDDIFDSVLLKSSPTININHVNQETERSSDVNERLELTPTENMHKALFSRHMRKDESSTPQLSKLRPKLLVSRINFDDSRSSSCASERIMSPVNRLTSSRLMNQSVASRCGKYSRLFSTYRKKSNNRFNSSMLSATGSWRNSSVADASAAAADLYSVSELRPHLTTPESKYIETADMTTPTKQQTPVRRNGNFRPSATLNDDEKRVAATAVSRTMIDERSELTLEVGRSPKVRQQPEKMSDRNRRTSISDLVERYKRVREKTVDVTSHLENSSDVSDESVKH